MPRTRIFALLLMVGICFGIQAQQVAPVQTTQSPATSDPSYQLAAEDEFTVTVIRHPEFSSDYLVPQAGDVQILAVGEIHVEGMTLAELNRKITSYLAENRLWKPEVTVTLKTARTRRVYVLGDVKQSGALDWKPGWTVSQLLSAAGGLDTDVQQNDVQVVIEHGKGGSQVKIRLTEALGNPDDPKLKIEPGDTVRVESIFTLPVYVSGHVIKPGLYRLRTDSANVLSAISEAGGVTTDASLTVRIQHPSGKEDVVDLAPSLVLGKKMDLPPVSGGDMVIVPEQQNRFTILGYVTRPGTYPIPDGHVYRLTDAVAAGADTSTPGATADKKGRISHIAIVRVVDNKQTKKVYDLNKFFKKGDQDQNPVIQNGDIIVVPQSNGVELTTSLSAISTAAILYSIFR